MMFWGLVWAAVVALVDLSLVSCISEGDALIALKTSLNDPASVLQSWTDSSNPCTWFHVACDPSGHVTRVDLGGAELSGFIAAELGNLQYLQYLNLFMNNISGPIPAELGELKSLVSLNLSMNKFSGEIPASLGELKSLVRLDLSVNNFAGEIPPTLGNLTSLAYLRLNDNKLTGGIPCEVTSIRSLKVVHISFLGSAIAPGPRAAPSVG